MRRAHRRWGRYRLAYLEVWLNDGSGGFTLGVAPSAIVSGGEQVWSIDLGDMDGDGDLDVMALVGGTANGVARWLPGDGTGTFGPTFTAHTFVGATAPVVGLVVGDLDNDGDLDVFGVSQPQSGGPQLSAGASVLYNQGGGTYSVSTVIRGNNPMVADFDGNGYLDGVMQVYAGGGFNSAAVWRNGPPFVPHFLNTSMPTLDTRGATYGDLDGDGDLDLPDHINDGSAVFTYVPGWSPAAMVGDFDGDGDIDQLDLTFVSPTTHMRIWRNQ